MMLISGSRVYSKEFIDDYIKGSNIYAKYNIDHSIGNRHYKVFTNTAPYSLQRVITDVYK